MRFIYVIKFKYSRTCAENNFPISCNSDKFALRMYSRGHAILMATLDDLMGEAPPQTLDYWKAAETVDFEKAEEKAMAHAEQAAASVLRSLVLSRLISF